ILRPEQASQNSAFAKQKEGGNDIFGKGSAGRQSQSQREGDRRSPLFGRTRRPRGAIRFAPTGRYPPTTAESGGFGALARNPYTTPDARRRRCSVGRNSFPCGTRAGYRQRNSAPAGRRDSRAAANSS